MTFKKPSFWDLKKPNLISHILNPLTSIIKINNFFLSLKPKRKFENLKTICVGNIYIGGTGKTPITIKLFEILKKLKNNISTAKKSYFSQNDERIMLEKKTELISGTNRKQIIKKAILANKELLIFDDGLQDKYINYDLQFVCFDGEKCIGNGRLIPAGPLRENLESIKKYDAIFIKNYSENTKNLIDQIKMIYPEIKIFFCEYIANNENIFDKKNNFLIFSGIGNPESFRDLLKKNNFKVVKEIIFPDHYQYKKEDIKKIKILANKLNAKIITTEKDYVKIKNLDSEEILFLELGLKFKDEKNLINFIKSKLYE